MPAFVSSCGLEHVSPCCSKNVLWNIWSSSVYILVLKLVLNSCLTFPNYWISISDTVYGNNYCISTLNRSFKSVINKLYCHIPIIPPYIRWAYINIFSGSYRFLDVTREILIYNQVNPASLYFSISMSLSNSTFRPTCFWKNYSILISKSYISFGGYIFVWKPWQFVDLIWNFNLATLTK